MKSVVPLQPQLVNAQFEAVLSETGTPIEGIVAAYAIDVPLLQDAADRIDGWIEQLHPSFLTTGGGGWSFLNLCHDKHGNLWTGEHRTMEQLCVMAIALDKGRWLMDRGMWSAFPGGMPYVAFDAPKR